MRSLAFDDHVCHDGLSLRIRAVRGRKWHYVVVGGEAMRSVGRWIRRSRRWPFGSALRRLAVVLFLAECGLDAK